MNLLSELTNQYMRVALIETAKHAGKHAAFDYLISKAEAGGVILGVTASGVGGIRLDSQDTAGRPRLWLPKETIVSVPVQLYDEADAGLEILRMTNYPTALGHILICRVVEPGHVTVAGPIAATYQKSMCEEMAELGAGLTLIDSAMSGRGTVPPDTADAAILSTGAVVSRNMETVVEETAHTVMLYSLPQIADEDAAGIIRRYSGKGKILVLRKYRGVSEGAGPSYDVQELDLKTSIGGTKYMERVLDQQVCYIYFPGAFTAGVVRDISRYNLSQITFVVDDPTDIAMDSASWAGLSKRGMKVEVLKDIKVAAITVNPFAPGGYSFDPRAFREEMRKSIPGIPVIDVREEARRG